MFGAGCSVEIEQRVVVRAVMTMMAMSMGSGVRWFREFTILVGMRHHVESVFLKNMLGKLIWILDRETALVSLHLRHERIHVCHVVGVVPGQGTLGNELTGVVGDE